jgi:transposase
VEIVVERAAGLDVHKATVVASMHTPEGQETRTFGTMTRDLEALADWLGERGVTQVAMEATGVFWQPVYNVLEEYPFELLLANAQHMKAVPGRKTDVQDAEWICDLLRHGLLRPSFVPSREQRERRELVRYRKTLVRERANEVNRLQKTLEGANIKLGMVATDILGASGREILKGLIEGRDDPAVLVQLAKGRLRTKQDALQQALYGKISAHQRFLLREQLAHIEELEARIERLSQELEERLRPFEREQAALVLLDAIPGVGRTVAETVIVEIGVDMSRFPSAAHLASWAGLCPGNNESGGKRKSGRTRKGDAWLRETLVEAARAAARTKGSYLGAQYRRIAARRGGKRAALAVAHSILVIIYHMLKDGTVYSDLGDTYFDQRDKLAVARRARKRLAALGFTVTIEELDAA